MRSLRGRLIGLWGLSLLSSMVLGALLVGLYRQSSEAQVARAQAVLYRACDLIRHRYEFYVADWSGPVDGIVDPGLKRDLVAVVDLALLRLDGVEGGIWSAASGSLAYAYPTYEGSGPKTDLPIAEREQIAAVNGAALSAERTVDRKVSARSQTLLLAGCSLEGPLPGLTGWVMTRVQTSGVLQSVIWSLLFLLVLLVLTTVMLGRTMFVWGRHVRGIEAALQRGGGEAGEADLPAVPRPGERELDRIVDALNLAASRLAASRQEAEGLASRVARSERMASLGRMAAGVAHEIRNPIAAARLQGENALAGDDRRRQGAIADMLVQLTRLDGLVSELLAMTQRVKPVPERVELPAFLRDLTDAHADAAAARSVTLRVDAPDEVVSFDPAVVRRILDNLLSNAIRHAAEGGSVIVAVRPSEQVLSMSVSDDGAGVPDEMQDRLFEPFVTGRADGTGLGLAIARELADAHEGRLLAAPSRRPGGVDRFRAGIATMSQADPTRTILVVDDDAALRRAVATTIVDLGHRAAEAADGEDAVPWLSRHRADAVLLDLRMPGMGGMETLRRIKALPDAPPVAVITAVPTGENTIEAMRLGAVDHLAKPVGRAGLAALLERMLQNAAPNMLASPASVGSEGDLVGVSAAMREVHKSIGLLADSDATVLLLGETGTGKEVVARAIHRHGSRSARPFVPVNCAAIPGELLESLLFGHVRGAFTGAVADRAGSFREAQGGTLFLDEIGDMNLAMQAKLLRVLQERVVMPLGGQAGRGRCPGDHGDAPQSTGGGADRDVPGGSLLSDRRGPARAAAIAGAVGGHHPAGGAFSRAGGWAARAGGRCGGAAAAAWMAGQYPRTGQRGHPSDDADPAGDADGGGFRLPARYGRGRRCQRDRLVGRDPARGRRTAGAGDAAAGAGGLPWQSGAGGGAARGAAAAALRQDREIRSAADQGYGCRVSGGGF